MDTRVCNRCGGEVHEQPTSECQQAGHATVSWGGHESGKPAQGDGAGWPFPASARLFKGSALLCCSCSRAFLAFMESSDAQEAPRAAAKELTWGGPAPASMRPSREAIASKMRQVSEETARVARGGSKAACAEPVKTDLTPEEIRLGWLSGTTCACKPKDVREVMFASDTHIVLKHRSHAEYTGRSSGSRTCNAYVRLYLRDEMARALAQRGGYGGYHVKPIKEWTGRINPRVVREDCAALGVEFAQ